MQSSVHQERINTGNAHCMQVKMSKPKGEMVPRKDTITQAILLVSNGPYSLMVANELFL